MEIIRNVAGMELKITLTEEELKSIVAEFATITFRSAAKEPAAEPVPVQEPKQFTMPKTTHVGLLTDHRAEVKAMVDQDYTYEQIAKYFGVSSQTVRRYVSEWGYRRPGMENRVGKGITMKEAHAMLEAQRSGMSVSQIAKEHRIAHATARYWINRAKADELAAA